MEIMFNYLYEAIKNNMLEWQVSNIYAVSLFVYDEDDDPNFPTVILGYNTISNFQDNIKLASEEVEAKWNFAFWLQNKEMIFGTGKTRKIVEQWMNENNLVDKDEKIIVAFINVLVNIVKKLHQSGVIKQKFGVEIPVIIHELEYYDEIAEQNIEANGYLLVEEFVQFCTIL